MNRCGNKAIVVAGGSTGDARWPAFKKLAESTITVLKFQGYAAEDIVYLTSGANPTDDVYASSENLRQAIAALESASVGNLVLLLLGSGAPGLLNFGAPPALNSAELDGWLDAFQSRSGAEVVVVYDADYAGSFLPVLSGANPERRYIITSSKGQALLLDSGSVSFSNFFWRQIFNGATIYDAFSHARLAVQFASNGQLAEIDEDGNGVGNERGDAVSSRRRSIGTGILLAGDSPLIASASAPQVLTSGTSTARIRADGVTSTADIARVFATIAREGSSTQPALVELQAVSELSYSNTYAGFTGNGVYEISIYAMDSRGNISLPKMTTVEQRQGVAGDAFEVDDTPQEASWIGVGGPVQRHNHHDTGDQDWAKFFATTNQLITLQTENLEGRADTLIQVYLEGNLSAPLRVDDNGGLDPLSSAIILSPPQDGFYLVRVTHAANSFGNDTGYDLHVFEEAVGERPGILQGVVTAANGAAIGNAMVRVKNFGGITVRADGGTGIYTIPALPGGQYQVEASAPFFISSSETVNVSADTISQHDFQLADAPPELSITPSTLTAGVVTGQQPLVISNTGGGTLNWSIAETCDWVTLSAPSGILERGETMNVLVSYSANSTNAGRTCTINATSTNGGGPNLVVLTQSSCAAPSAPANLVAADGVDNNFVRVTWNAADGASEYQVYRGATADLSEAVLLATVTTTFYDDTSDASKSLAAGYMSTIDGGGGTSALLALVFSLMLIGIAYMLVPMHSKVSAPSILRLTPAYVAVLLMMALVSGCQNGGDDPTPHHYWVRAVNSCGTGDLSNGDSGHLKP